MIVLLKLNTRMSSNALKLKERETGGEIENYIKLPKESKLKIIQIKV